MLTTVENVSDDDLNALDEVDLGDGPSGGVASGGARVNPLPYPFGHVGTLASGDSIDMPTRPSDWHYKPVPSLPMTPETEWQQLIQAGMVTIVSVAETILAATVNPEEVYLGAI